MNQLTIRKIANGYIVSVGIPSPSGGSNEQFFDTVEAVSAFIATHFAA